MSQTCTRWARSLKLQLSHPSWVLSLGWMPKRGRTCRMLLCWKQGPSNTTSHCLQRYWFYATGAELAPSPAWDSTSLLPGWAQSCPCLFSYKSLHINLYYLLTLRHADSQWRGMSLSLGTKPSARKTLLSSNVWNRHEPTRIYSWTFNQHTPPTPQLYDSEWSKETVLMQTHSSTQSFHKSTVHILSPRQ